MSNVSPAAVEPSVVAQLFGAIGIKRVVYIDDRFGITRERIIALCRALSPEQIAASLAFPNLDVTGEEAIREARLARAIEELKDENLQETFDTIQAVAGNGGAEQDILASRAFSETLGTAAEVCLLSLADWKSRSHAIIAEVAAKPTLFVCDDDFSLEGGGKNEGRKLIDQLHRELVQYKYAYALLTHNATTEASEAELEKDIAQQFPDIKDFVVVIAKARLTGDGRERFVHRLKSTLLFRLFRVLKGKLKEAAAAAHNEALGKIDSLGVDAFERIVYRSSREEGAWSPETLVRIVSVIQDREVRSQLRADAELHGAILDIDPLCAVETIGVSDEVEKTARDLQRSEVYDNSEDLNQLHIPLDFGDIFKTDTDACYVLVAQPCELVVRNSGRRKKDAREERHMVALVPVNSRKQRKGTPFHENEFELCHFGESTGNIWLGQVNCGIQVPLWVLDLAVLNSNGECNIAVDQQAAALLMLPWKNRLEVLKARAAKVVELADAAKIPAGAPYKELLHSLLRLPLETPFVVNIGPADRQPGGSWQLHVGLRRIARLRERYAASLLMRYSSYQSRLAFPHDLTRLR